MLDYGSQTKDLVNSIETLKGCLRISEPYALVFPFFYNMALCVNIRLEAQALSP